MSPYTGSTPHRLLEHALERLDEALARPVDPLIRDAAIKRFEFTFEMAWKAIQAQARREALDCLSPRDCFRTAFRLGLVENDERWMRMVEDRNRTSHTYNEKTAQEIYGALSAYSSLFRDLLARLRTRHS